VFARTVKQMNALTYNTLNLSNKTFRSISTFCAFALIGGVLSWDVIAMIYAPNDTISNVLTVWNQRTGGLLALIFFALFIHWFLPMPACWTGCQSTKLY
jgi:hypothetical protein